MYKRQIKYRKRRSCRRFGGIVWLRMNRLLTSMLLSLLPIVELRGGIPYAISNGISPLVALILCTFANIFVTPICFFFLDNLHKLLLKIKIYKKNFNLYIKSIRKRKEKVEKNYQTYGIFALTIFVAIPLPITGAWTGALVAWLLGFKRTRSFFAISLGVIIAGIIVTLITTGILTALNFLL
ncbi:MAG: small multi-drug export protein [Candidatus Pacearchaeota archaeon]|nr:small multi-drug export protein [Candidatus Pacearchaeota archaeon]